MKKAGFLKVLDDKTLEIQWTEETLKKNNILSKKPKKTSIVVSKDQMTFDPAMLNLKKFWKRAE